MKILVVSDTHGHGDRLKKAVEKTLPFEMLIHCGDGLKDLASINLPVETVVTTVKGNTDVYYTGDSEEFIIENIMGRRVAITHGHMFHVKAGTSYLFAEAARMGVDAVLFGHTHVRQLSPGFPLLFNPGSLSDNSYGVILAEDEGEWIFEHRSLV